MTYQSEIKLVAKKNEWIADLRNSPNDLSLRNSKYQS